MTAEDSDFNVLFIVLDTARAQNLSFYGYEQDTTPNLSQLAAESTIYEDAVSPSPWSLPSHVSMLTGCYPSTHGAHENSIQFNGGLPTLQEFLSQHGCYTTAVSSNSWVSPEFGVTEGFDSFVPVWKLVNNQINSREVAELNLSSRIRRYFSRGKFVASILNILYRKSYYKKYDYGALRANYEIKKQLIKENKPFFAFVNYFEPHLEYGPPKFVDEFVSETDKKVNQNAWKYVFGSEEMTSDDFSYLESLYNAELRYTDYRLGNILSKLKERGIYDETLVVVTSDHGENIGDHSLMDHQYSLHRSLLHVPLVVKYPKSVDISVDRVSTTVSTIDIFPTIMTLLDESGKDRFDGRPLPPLGSVDKSRYILSEYLSPFPGMDSIKENYPSADRSQIKKYDRSIVSIQNDAFKYVSYSDGTEYVYDKDSNGRIIEDLADFNKASKDKLTEIIEGQRGENLDLDTNVEIDDEVSKNLRSLGYLN